MSISYLDYLIFIGVVVIAIWRFLRNATDHDQKTKRKRSQDRSGTSDDVNDDKGKPFTLMVL